MFTNPLVSISANALHRFNGDRLDDLLKKSPLRNKEMVGTEEWTAFMVVPFHGRLDLRIRLTDSGLWVTVTRAKAGANQTPIQDEFRADRRAFSGLDRDTPPWSAIVRAVVQVVMSTFDAPGAVPAGAEDAHVPDIDPLAHTADTARAAFLEQAVTIARYWAQQPNMTPLERTEGTVFSLLVMFDGESGFMPPFDIVARPHPDDKQYLRGEGETYFPEGLVLNDDAELHGEFLALAKARAAKSN